MDYELNQKYLKDPFDKDMDGLRLDDHLIIDGKIIVMGESRAWVDKPFYLMKAMAIQQILLLPHGKNNTIEDVIFPILTFAYDVTEKTKYTMDKTMELVGISNYTSRVLLFNLSGYGRKPKIGYFTRGYSEQECAGYVSCVYKHLEKYKNGELNM